MTGLLDRISNRRPARRKSEKLVCEETNLVPYSSPGVENIIRLSSSKLL